MKAFIILLITTFFLLLVYIVGGAMIGLVTGNILPLVNQTGADYSMIEGNYNIIHTIFPLIIVSFAIGTVVVYLLQSHQKEYAEYETRERWQM